MPRRASAIALRSARTRGAGSTLRTATSNHRWGRVGAVLLLATAALLPAAGGALAADTLAMNARVLLAGHTRVGSWMAIAVDLENTGPAIVGELRVAAGSQGRTRFGLAVDLPTGSRQSFTLYAQPPAFGASLDVNLVATDGQTWKRPVAFTSADAGQLMVAVVADRPQAIVKNLRLSPGQSGSLPAVFSITPDQLPDRVEAWDGVDRIIWQDTDSTALKPAQLAALQGWLAAGGRLVIVGGTNGPASLSAFPDAILPFRPAATLDVAPASLAPIVGELPATTGTLPALSGELLRGHALAKSGDRVVAAEAPYGLGMVSLIGFDPTTAPVASTAGADALWARLIPQRTTGGPVITGDDSNLVNSLYILPALALPPIGGLIALLAGYIVLVGPVNYLVLRRLDRREWAWITMPLVIVGFAVGAYVYGATLRGGSVIVNQVAVVRGAPDTTEGTAEVYFGVFSPNRATYQVTVPGGALLAAPNAADGSGPMGGVPGAGSSTPLDVVQGDPARIRDLAVGVAQLRAIRGEAPVTAPRIQASLRLAGNHLMGTVKNASDETLESPAIVLGGAVAVLADLAPGATATIDLVAAGDVLGQTLSDKILGGAAFFGDTSSGDKAILIQTRRALVDQLTFDPQMGITGQLQTSGPVFLAFANRNVIPVTVDGQVPRRLGNVLYYIPMTIRISGQVTFTPNLVRGTLVGSDNPMFGKGDPSFIQFNQGTLTMAYRPIAFEGTIQPTRLLLAVNQGGGPVAAIGATTRVDAQGIATDDPAKPADIAAQANGFPDLQLFDVRSGRWMRFPHPEGTTYEVDHPERYVDPGTGTVLVRFRSDRPDGGGLQFGVQLEGSVQ